MPGFDGTGPGGMGPMTGGGRGFCSPWGVRSAGYAYGNYASRPYGYYRYGYGAYSPQVSAKQELEFLKDQASALRGQLSTIESRIEELGKK